MSSQEEQEKGGRQPSASFFAVARCHELEAEVTRLTQENEQLRRDAESGRTPFNLTEVGDGLVKHISELTKENERLKAEIRVVDEALARRSALDDLPDRYSKIFRACSEAGRADALARELESLNANASSAK